MFRKIHAVLLAAIMVVSAVAITVCSAFAAEASTFTLEATSNAFPTKTSTYSDINTFADSNGDIYVTVDYDICADGKQLINFQMNKLEWDPTVLQYETSVNTVKVGRESRLNLHPLLTEQGFASVTNTDCITDGYIISNFSNISKSAHAYAYNIDADNNPLPGTIVRAIFKVIDPTVTKTTVNLDMYILSLDDEATDEPYSHYQVINQGEVSPEYVSVSNIDTKLSPEGDVIEPVENPTTEPVTEPETEPVTDEPVETEPVTTPATPDEPQTVPDETFAPETEPVTEPITEPVTEPITEPVTEPATEAHVHTALSPVTENLTTATCTSDGSYDEVTYCEGCGEVLNRKTITIPATGHSAKFVAEIPATERTEGTKAHYVCETCKAMFSDQACKHEVTSADLVIPKLQPATVEPDTVKPTTEAPTEAPSNTDATTPVTNPADDTETTTSPSDASTTPSDTVDPSKGEPSTDATSTSVKTSSTTDEGNKSGGTTSYNSTGSNTSNNGAIQTGQSTAAIAILAILIVLSAASVFVIRSRKSDTN